MQVTKEWMERWFAQFNHDYFGDALPLPRLALSKSRTRLGSMSCKRQVRLFHSRLSDYAIHLSNYYDLSERQFQNVLLHEMIHYSIAYNGRKDSSPHGVVFRAMMEELNRKYGWELSVTTSTKNVEKAGGIPQNKTYLILSMEMKDGRRFLSVVNPRAARQLERQTRLVADLASHGWYTTQNPYFFGFPAVRTLRARRIRKAEYDSLVADLKPFAI
jgi:hypothetical protein